MTVVAESRSPAASTALAANRLDVQGLRGIAILVGIPFHAALPVPGGFIALDMFFVISGFVITGMIYRERELTQTFSFRRFYLRRFKRLTPALALTVGVTMILSFLFLPPFGAQQVAAQTGLGAMLLTANFVISGNTGDYFGVPAKTNPLLHTWSLSAEEQFYLMFPALLALAWMLSRRVPRRQWPTVLVAAVVVISFGCAVTGGAALGPFKPFAKYLVGYYGPVSRSWEFAAGALLALVLRNRKLKSGWQVHAVAWPGMALLCCSPWVINSSLYYPGWWTLLPVSGVLLLITAGTGHNTVVTRILSAKFFAKFGDWSYSIYLWHWPLIVFALVIWPQIPYVAAIAAALSILPAVASYRWVEEPIRKLPRLGARRTTALITAVVTPPILLAAVVQWAADNYWLPRYTSGNLAVYQGNVDTWVDYYANLQNTYYQCTDQAVRENALEWHGFTRCRQSKPDPRIDVAVVGDSHAEQMFVGLAEALPNKNVVYYIVDGPVWKSASERMNRIVDHVAADASIKTVIVNSGWFQRGLNVDELAKTFQLLTSTGKAVFTTDDLSTFDFDAAACKYRVAPILPYSRCTEARKVFEQKYATYSSKLEEAVRSAPGTVLLRTGFWFCDDRVCSMTKGTELMYRDQYHLNEAGSRYLINRMLAEFPAFKGALA